MALCRVYIKPDNSVVVLRPNPRLRENGESEDAFLERICAKDAPLSNLHLLPHTDLDSKTLPERALRAQWEFRNERLAIKGKPL